MGKYSEVEAFLIEEIQQLPALWKTIDPNYKIAVMKEDVWREVAEAMNWETGKTYLHKL